MPTGWLPDGLRVASGWPRGQPGTLFRPFPKTPKNHQKGCNTLTCRDLGNSSQLANNLDYSSAESRCAVLVCVKPGLFPHEKDFSRAAGRVCSPHALRGGRPEMNNQTSQIQPEPFICHTPSRKRASRCCPACFAVRAPSPTGCGRTGCEVSLRHQLSTINYLATRIGRSCA